LLFSVFDFADSSEEMATATTMTGRNLIILLIVLDAHCR